MRAQWQRQQPGLTLFLWFGAVQACNCAAAGEIPSEAWTLHAWAPLEVLVLETAIFAAMECHWSRWWALVGATVGAVALCAVRWGIDLPGGYGAFLRVREWVWISIAASVGAHSLWLIARPRHLAAGVYRSRWLLVAYAAGMAIAGASWPETGALWQDRRAIWRCVAVVILCRWCLAISRAPYSAGGSAACRLPRTLPPR